MKIKTFYQTNSKACGIAALKSFLYYHSNGVINDIKEDINHQEYSLLELKDIAIKEGINVNGIELENLDINNIPNYSICLIRINDSLHYVFYLYKKKRVHIIDPIIGKITLKENEFLKILTPYLLIFDSIILKNKKPEKIDKFNIKMLVLEIIQSLPLLLLFISFSEDGYISFSLLIIYWLIYFIKRLIIISSMSKFDIKLEKIIKNNKDINYENIKNLYAYKEHKFSYIASIYNFVFIKFVFVLFTLLLPMGFILTFSYLFTLLIDYFSYLILNKDIYNINRIEHTSNDNYNKFKTLNEYTNMFIFKKEILKIFSIIFFMVVLIIYANIVHINVTMITGLIITSIYIIINNDFYSINNKYKNYMIKRTIYKNLE